MRPTISILNLLSGALNIVSAFFHYNKGQTIAAVVCACAAICFTVAALAWGKTNNGHQ